MTKKVLGKMKKLLDNRDNYSHMDLAKKLGCHRSYVSKLTKNKLGILTRKKKSPKNPKTKEELLKKWDEQTDVINHYFNLISEERFQETFNLFGEYEFPVYQNILYFVDNEVHHRGQGYVYLRALGIEPPFFWERF